MSRQRQQSKKKKNASRSRSRSHEKHKSKRDNWQDRKHQDRRENRQDDRQGRNDSWGRDKSYNKHGHHHHRKQQNRTQRQKPAVRQVAVDPPKSFILSHNTITGTFKSDILKSDQYPSRVEHSHLGELKNKITPIQKLWSSHIKQYLNISEFVQIFRFNRSLAFSPTEYGKSIINYEEDSNSIVYNNLTAQAPIFSRAYFKLWEILETGVLEDAKDRPLSIGCVAEGPGGFIHALVDYRLRQQRTATKIQHDTYNAITLKIDENTRHAKDWSDQRATKLFRRLREIGQNINLSYGQTGTGNLLLPENISHFREEVKAKCQLVTGDGGIECIGDKQFQYQEVFNAKLFFGEIITALHIQEQLGKFILKIYDIGFQVTRQLIMLLALYYQKVTIIKPITSRPGNSQKYLLCEGFKGIKESELSELIKILKQWTVIEPNLSYFENKEYLHNLFDFSHLANYDVVYQNIKEANDWFVEEQIQKIEEGLALCEKHRGSARSIEDKLTETRWKEQISFAYCWCRKYGLPTIEVQNQE